MRVRFLDGSVGERESGSEIGFSRLTTACKQTNAPDQPDDDHPHGNFHPVILLGPVARSSDYFWLFPTDLASYCGTSDVEIFEIIIDNWNPAIGDPTVSGWSICFGYLLAGILLLIQRNQAMNIYGFDDIQTHRWWLLCLAISMIVLGINKQLDIQSWLTHVGRDVAKLQGWYEDRRRFQAFVAVCLTILSLVAAIWLLRATGRWGAFFRHHRLALFGVALLGVFVVFRSIHSLKVQIPWIRELSAGDSAVANVVELAGIGLIGGSALSALYKARKVGSVTR